MNNTKLQMNLHQHRSGLFRRHKEYQAMIFSEENQMIIGSGNEDGDRSTMENISQMSILKMETISKAINQIDRALKMIELGVYGVCSECHENIGEKRLTSVPFAIYCVNCQELVDKKQQEASKKYCDGM